MPPHASPDTRASADGSASGQAPPGWVALALRADVVHRSWRVALVVGSLLVAINHGDRLLAGGLVAAAWLKIALTYLVPYAVSTWASVGAIRSARGD